MKIIGIFGQGYVGSAVSASHKEDTLIIRDPKLGKNSASLEEIKKADGIYICVPTPMLEDGTCDVSYVESVLKEISDYNKVIISKSTLPPGIYKNLQITYKNLVHCPEFLTAANATNDYINSPWVLVGGDIKYVNDAIEIISTSNIKASHYHKTDIGTASIFKYIANSFLATKVTFMNDMYHLVKELNLSWEEIKKIAEQDSRLGNSHWDVPGPDGKFGFGGACFPKDVAAIVKHGLDLGVHLELLDRVETLNKKQRGR